MEMDHFYRLGLAFMRGALHLELCSDLDTYALMRGEIAPSEPVIFKYYMGGKPKDLIGTTHATLFLVSTRVVTVLQDEGFTGWRTYPVRVFTKHKELVPDCHGFQVVGRCGLIDLSRSVKVWQAPYVPHGQGAWAWRGEYFDPTTWDGSDIFQGERGAGPVVTERVKLALERAKLSNLWFTRLSEVEAPILEGFPDRLAALGR